MIGFLRDAVRVLSMSCRSHAELLSRQLDEPLPRGVAFGLRVHLLYCRGCRRFRDQLRHLRELGRACARQMEAVGALPADARARLGASIDRRASK